MWQMFLQRELHLMGATAGIRWVLSTHVLFPLSPCMGTTVAGREVEAVPALFHEDLCPSGISPVDSGSVAFSHWFLVKAIGGGYFAVWRHFQRVLVIAFFSRGHLNTRKQVDNQNKSESSVLIHCLYWKSLLFSLCYGPVENSLQAGFCQPLGW